MRDSGCSVLTRSRNDGNYIKIEFLSFAESDVFDYFTAFRSIALNHFRKVYASAEIILRFVFI